MSEPGSSARGGRAVGLVCLAALAFAVCVACTEEPIVRPSTRTSSITTARDAAVEAGPAADELVQLDGEPCNNDTVCESGHCNNNVCCVDGECCREASDCSASDKPGMCTDPASCNGMKPTPACERNQCRMRMGENDSACDSSIEADDCGLYKSVFCSGATKQNPPECPDSCDGDDACDPGAHCEGAKCVANAATGMQCMADSECQTGRCVNGFCCDSDNCCTKDTDCDPAEYGKPQSCDDPATCQGSSGVPVCRNGRCGTKLTEDDSACNDQVVANDCSGGAKVYCRGGVTQSTPPACASGTCSRDLDCVRSAYCKAGTGFFAAGMCTPDLPNGGRCDRAEVCQSGHCSESSSAPGSSGVCCSYDCCDSTARCPGVECDAMMMMGCSN